MSLSAAVSGFVVFLLSLSVIQGQDGWGVTYSSTEICALKGSTVDMSCTYRYPSTVQRVENRFWFRTVQNENYVDLKNEPGLSGRVQYDCINKDCSLRITDLTESDSAEYKFIFITDQEGGKYTGSPGVTLRPHREIRGADMSLSAAVSGFVVFLLSVSVIQGQYGWGVTYSSTEICAFKGSTVDMSCTYRYPSTVQRVENRFWYTKVSHGVYTHLTTDPQYSGRVQYIFGNKDCTLRITDLRESDSAEYKFRFTTDQEGGKYTGKPGVTLRVTDLQVRVNKLQVYPSKLWAELMCHSRCPLPGHPHYVWYKNEQIIQGETSSYYSGSFTPADSFSCAVAGHENCRSPPVYAPRLPSVSVSPSAEIVEGSSVTLTCSSDANPAAKYTWYKENQTLIQGPEGVYHLSSISSEDRGNYSCKSENQYGEINSTSLFIDVQYGPRLPSVSVSPSAEIVEGSSVTLTCSSDANPAANYTWYKENEDSPKASGQIFTITDFRAEHSGNYYCEVQNRRGRNKTSVHLTVAVNSTKIMNIIRLTLVVLMLIPLLLLSLWTRKKKTLSSTTEPQEPVEMMELDSRPVYEDVSDFSAGQTEDML
ncbi:pregnancy-specific beta-1-glycoprotein 7-like [Acanthopagrus schlegelii]